MTQEEARINAPAQLLPHRAAELVGRLRAERPRVHAITNAAAQTLTANLLLAAGGIPSLTTSPEEISAFTARADALVVNLGTLDADRRAAIPWAIATARALGRPWVLDPVFVETSPSRLALARLCLAGHPAILRCNRAEFEAITEREATAEEVMAQAHSLQCTIALTGPTDMVCDGDRLLVVANGHPLMTRVTAMGCAGSALVAAFAALEPDPLLAAAGALLVLGIAGEVAAETARGPGSFQAAILDALDGLDRSAVAARARVS